MVDADGKLLKEYAIPYTSRIRVHDGDTVESGTALTEGPINPQCICCPPRACAP